MPASSAAFGLVAGGAVRAGTTGAEGRCERYQLFADLPDVMNTAMAAKALDTNGNTLRELIRDGQLRAVRVGRVYKVSKRALIEFVEGGGCDE